MKAIVAVNRDGTIGKEGSLPWSLKEDLANFKKLTMHGNLIMGRKTFESLPGILPSRNHIVLTNNIDRFRDLHWSCHKEIDNATFTVFSNIDRLDYLLYKDETLFGITGPNIWDLYPRENWVIGGAEIYSLLSERVTDLYVTLVHQKVYNGDTFFPWDQYNKFTCIGSSEELISTNHIKYQFMHYKRM